MENNDTMDALTITVNADGTATATVGAETQTFPDIHAAAVWAESLLYQDEEGEDSG
jgi:hypothetical protein